MDSMKGGTSVSLRKKSPVRQVRYRKQPHVCPESCLPRTAVTPEIFHSKVNMQTISGTAKDEM